MTKNSAFSLIELSIVITVLGTLVSGIVVGKNLIRAAEIRNFVNQISEIKSAIIIFEEKYSQLPGDMSNATFFWPTTQNGDGNGYYPWTDGIHTERVYFWHHLGLSGLYREMAVPDTNTKIKTAGLTMPDFDISPKAALMPNYRGQTDAANRYDIYKNYFQFGKWRSNDNILGAFDTITAYEIDSKMDDGNGSNGDVISYNHSGGTGANCMTATWDAPTGGADYVFSHNDITCRMGFFF